MNLLSNKRKLQKTFQYRHGMSIATTSTKILQLARKRLLQK